jgi:lysosomal acid phosphatase
MKAFAFVMASASLYASVATQPTPPEPDKLLFVYEITRHGARFGLGSDYFNETNPDYRPGELTEIGKRQQYLMGQEIRRRYAVKNKIIDLN